MWGFEPDITRATSGCWYYWAVYASLWYADLNLLLRFEAILSSQYYRIWADMCEKRQTSRQMDRCSVLHSNTMRYFALHVIDAERRDEKNTNKYRCVVVAFNRFILSAIRIHENIRTQCFPFNRSVLCGFNATEPNPYIVQYSVWI